MSAGLQEPTLRVLIIDADNVRRGMLACTLPAARYALEFARSLEKGLDLLSRLQPEVVIVGRDASVEEICQRVRSLPAGMTCTLVLMDEQYRNETVGESEAEAVGADAYLPFPFEAVLFEERLQARRRSPPPVPAPVPGGQSPELQPSPRGATPSSAPETVERAWDRFRERVESLFARLGSLDYYALLELTRQAGPAEIKDAYFKCSMELHPDRFMQLEHAELRHQIYEVYKRMSEAFKVLIDPAIRSRYDAGLNADREHGLRFLDRARQLTSFEDPTLEAFTPAGKRYLHFANLAEAEGNLRSARMYLTLALQCEPQNSALRGRLEGVTRRLEP